VWLLRQVDRVLKLSESINKALDDPRRRASCQQDGLSLVRQRLYALALSYEDLNDHHTLRGDFCRDQLLVSYLRPSKIDGAKHAWAILSLLVKRLRQRWPKVRIVLRADSGFCRWRMLSRCERHAVEYIVGIARNTRLNLLRRAGAR
jgi:hypothetical protein